MKVNGTIKKFIILPLVIGFFYLYCLNMFSRFITNIREHISAFTCQIIMSSCWMFMLNCQILTLTFSLIHF